MLLFSSKVIDLFSCKTKMVSCVINMMLLGMLPAETIIFSRTSQYLVVYPGIYMSSFMSKHIKKT